MAHLPQGAASSAAAPLLDVWIADGRLLVNPDPGSLTFSIYDISTEEKEADPVRVIGPITVDLAAHRIQMDPASDPPEPGHFAAAFQLAADEATGAHEIRWSWEYTTTPPTTPSTQTLTYGYTERFDVLAGVPVGYRRGGYGLVSDFRAEGFDVDRVSDVRLLKLIHEQSRYAETVTGRFFEPRFLDMRIDGADRRGLLLGMPIIALDGVAILDDPIAIDTTSRECVIYNRHLRGLVDPDDRWAPRLEIPEVYSLIDPYGNTYGFSYPYPPVRLGFPRSSQNVHVQGLFGYTDPDPRVASGGTSPAWNPIGVTPEGLKKAVRLLVIRNMPKLACDIDAFDAKMAGRVTQMRTRDQSIVYASAGLGEGQFTGDLELDRLLSQYARPVRCAAT